MTKIAFRWIPRFFKFGRKNYESLYLVTYDNIQISKGKPNFNFNRNFVK